MPLSKVGLIRLSVIALFVLALELACQRGIIARTVMIAPSAMATNLWRLLGIASMREAIYSTLGSVLVATVIAVLGGFLMGATLHALPRLRHAFDPLLASYYAVPTFLFYPVMIVFLGVGHTAIIAIAVMSASVVMIIATISGLDQVPRALHRTGLVMRMGWVSRTWRIVLPSAAPQLFSGVKLAVAYGFIGVIASEFILSGEGLGYAIANAYNEFNNRTMYALMLLVVLVVGGINAMLHGWDQSLAARRRR